MLEVTDEKEEKAVTVIYKNQSELIPAKLAKDPGFHRMAVADESSVRGGDL